MKFQELKRRVEGLPFTVPFEWKDTLTVSSAKKGVRAQQFPAIPFLGHFMFAVVSAKHGARFEGRIVGDKCDGDFSDADFERLCESFVVHGVLLETRVSASRRSVWTAILSIV